MKREIHYLIAEHLVQGPISINGSGDTGNYPKAGLTFRLGELDTRSATIHPRSVLHLQAGGG